MEITRRVTGEGSQLVESRKATEDYGDDESIADRATNDIAPAQLNNFFDSQ